MSRVGQRGGGCLLVLVVLVAASEGLRCYVCNSKADSRCADPIQTAEEPTEGQDSDASDNKNSNNNNNDNNKNNNNNNQYEGQNEGLQMVDCKVAHSVRQAMDAVSKRAGSTPFNTAVASSILPDASVCGLKDERSPCQVNGLLSRLGQRAPGGGDVWAAVTASTQASLAAAGAIPGSSSGQGQPRGQPRGQQHGGGLLGQRGGQQGGQPANQKGNQQGNQQGGYRSGQRGFDDQDPNAACHKVDMEVDGEMITDRGCAPGRILGQDPCEALAAALGETESCELCDGDGCNTASTARASTAAAAVAAFLLGLHRALWQP